MQAHAGGSAALLPLHVAHVPVKTQPSLQQRYPTHYSLTPCCHPFPPPAHAAAAAALLLQSLQARQARGGPVATDSGATVAGASHIQQIHISSGRRTPYGGHSPRAHSPVPGISPWASPRPGRSPRAGATAEVCVAARLLLSGPKPPNTDSHIPSDCLATACKLLIQ